MGEEEMNWYMVEFSVEQAAAGGPNRLLLDFKNCFDANGRPKTAAMFYGKNSLGRVYYFSPDAATIALPVITACHGVECIAPAKTDLALSFGEWAEGIPFSN